jgi:membrane protein YqaA with SNARE-associated domain
VDIPGLRRLYRWMLGMVTHRHAPAVLFGVSIAEAVILPIPKEVMMVPMIAARPSSWLRLAIIATIGSGIGAAIGWFIGWALYDTVGAQIVALFGMAEAEAQIRTLYAEHGWLVVFMAVATPIPDEVVTIGAGMAGMPLWSFVAAYLIARAIRHLAVAYVAARFGPPLLAVVERRLSLVAGGSLVLLAAGLLILPLL